MKLSFKPLKDQVVVITGASSGIGLATARAAARQGAKIVLVSRNDVALEAVTQQIQVRGCEAIHVTADVGLRDDVQRVADAAVSQFGRVDTWVNNAGVAIFGRIEEISDDDNSRLFQTNFWGVVYGSLVALPLLKRQGGTLINVGSVVSDQAVPLQGMYSASKHAVKAFTDALRMELAEEKAPVSVTLIKPASIDTPYPQHARNYLEREPKLLAPVYAPEEVAKAILFAATHAKRDIYVGGGGRAMSLMNRIAPPLMDQFGSRVLAKQQIRDEPPRDPEGALHRAGSDGRVRGDHPGYVMSRSYYTRSSLHPMVSAAVLVGIGAVTYVLVRRRSGKSAAPVRALMRPPRQITVH